MRRGFTLVELSIVLVIIGLLIGGILVAQSMIETARTQSLVRQMQQYHIMVQNFRTSYNCWPADCTIFTPPGDGNGSSITPAETLSFWMHLQQAGLLQASVTYSNDITAGYNSNPAAPTAPAIEIGTGLTQAYGAYLVNLNNSGIIQYVLGDFNGCLPAVSYGICTTPIFTPSFMLAVDAKIDDGAVYGGNFQNVFAGNTSACVSGGKYNVATNAKACKILYYDVIDN